jgi:3-isopropylmalate/(R)-2-methylmalate dehydratase small subunit
MIAGRVWKFGDNINTDLMMPGPALYVPEQERVRYIFQANRPGWVDVVRRGDFIIGGKNFGLGSSRPAALSLRNVGIGCLLAESVNGLFFRNCVSFGLLALECPGIHAAFAEGQIAELSIENFTVRNPQTGAVLKAGPAPQQLIELMCAGGVFPLLEREGLIAPVREDHRPNASAPHDQSRAG